MTSPMLRHQSDSPAKTTEVCPRPGPFVRRDGADVVVDLAAAERATAGITRLPEHSSYEQVSRQLQQRHREQQTRRRWAWAAGLIGFPAAVALGAQVASHL